jgi:preprotein translocase subunit SecE
MARIRPAKTQTDTGKGVNPPPASAPARRRPSNRSQQRAARPRPAPQQRTAKTGSVTKAVQVHRASRFLSEVVAELRKVSWPDRQALFQATAVVIICVAVVATYLGILDAIFRRVVDAIF